MLIASKDTRFVLAAAGKPVMDFGLRRSHGAKADCWLPESVIWLDLLVQPQSWLPPFFAVPIFGTMGHRFVPAHQAERHAFDHFADAQPVLGSDIDRDDFDVDSG